MTIDDLVNNGWCNSMKTVFSFIREEKVQPVTSKRINNNIQLSDRTIRYALRRLVDENVLEKFNYLLDMRQYTYSIKTEL